VSLLCTWFGVGCLAGTLSGPATVWDGDTIYIGREAVRLAGIDAEELDEPHGYAARDHLRQLIGNRIVTCKWDGYSYKRKVGVCFVDATISLNGQMVADGFALDCFHYSNGQYRSLEPTGARSRLIQKGYCK
jgi:micrococcal nuclease